jgi:hypothetical protein
LKSIPVRLIVVNAYCFVVLSYFSVRRSSVAASCVKMMKFYCHTENEREEVETSTTGNE